MFFVMSCRLRLGSLLPLHFFEPRYRYMCRHLSVGGVFGFLNEGRGVHCGVSGVLCEVMDLSMNSNGTYDALILAKSSFTLAEVWMEPMPRLAMAAVPALRWVTRGDLGGFCILYIEWVCSKAASRLQSMVRAVDAKKQLRQGTLVRSAAAQWIQTAWRRHRAVRRCSELRQKGRQLSAGLRIQSHWRGHVSRKSSTPILRRRQVAASRLQGMLRMARAREEVLRLREERQLKELLAVTKIQSLMRSYQARKEVTPQLQERRRQQLASVKVQSSWRRQMAKAEAMKRRAQDVNQLLSSLLEGRPDETLRGDAWLQKVTAAFEWKAQRDVELEEKELRLRRQSAFSHLPSASVEELSRPESLSAAALLDRSMAAVCVAKQRARHRMKALLQTQAHGNKGHQSLTYDNEICKSLAVDHGVLIRLNAEDGVAEVGNLLQTAWSIAFQLQSAAPVAGASPALHVLTSGIHSLKRKLRIEIQGAGKVSALEESAALKSFMEAAEEACNEAVRRATEARNATLQPLKEELEAALAESEVALKDLNGHVSKVRPEADAIKAKYKEDAVEAEAKLREEREMKHAQTDHPRMRIPGFAASYPIQKITSRPVGASTTNSSTGSQWRPLRRCDGEHRLEAMHGINGNFGSAVQEAVTRAVALDLARPVGRNEKKQREESSDAAPEELDARPVPAVALSRTKKGNKTNTRDRLRFLKFLKESRFPDDQRQLLSDENVGCLAILVGMLSALIPDAAGCIAEPCDYWNPRKKSTTTSQTASASAAAIPVAAARKLEAPIEDRFTKQAAEWEAFKDQQIIVIKQIQETSTKEVAQLQKDMAQIKDAVSTQGKAFDKQNILNAKEFGTIREKAKEQFKLLAATLQESMKQSLSKQDHAMSSQFQEIKMMLQNREIPPKKPRHRKRSSHDVPLVGVALGLSQCGFAILSICLVVLLLRLVL
eukprot:s176_g42.t2